MLCPICKTPMQGEPVPLMWIICQYYCPNCHAIRRYYFDSPITKLDKGSSTIYNYNAIEGEFL